MNQAGGGPGNGGVPVPNGVSVPPPVGSTSGSSLRYHNPSHHQSHHQPPHYPKHNGYMLNGSLAPIALSSIPVSTSGIPMGTSGMQATTGSRHGAHVPSPTLTQATASPATGATIMTTTNSLQGALSHTHTHSIAKSHSSNSSSGSGSSSSHTGIRGGGAGGAGGAGMAEQQQQIQRERDLGFGSRTTLLGHAHAEISSTSSGSPPIVEVSIPSASQPSSTSGGTTHIGGIGREVGTGGPGQVIDVNQEMQRQLDDYNRSITIVVWYKPHTPPLRIQHITTTFPYFHLGQLPHLTHSLNLVPSPSLPSSSSLSHPSPSHPSYLDTYDPTTKTWELHGVENVRVVRGQQRVLYRVRKTFLEGLEEGECPGLGEEIARQGRVGGGGGRVEMYPGRDGNQGREGTSLKRGREEGEEGRMTKVPRHSSSHTHPHSQPQPHQFQLDPTPSLSPPNSGLTHTPMSLQSTIVQEPVMASLSTMGPPPPPAEARRFSGNASPMGTTVAIPEAPPPPRPASTSSSPQVMPASTSSSSSPTTTSSPPKPSLAPAPKPPSKPSTLPLPKSTKPPIPIPHHPHPPLKRWPNDYTVAEISRGFEAMDELVRRGVPSSQTSSTTGNGEGGEGKTTAAGGTPITQKLAFELIFGSRYVKSTVCRHRGLWRRADPEIRREFEEMSQGGEEGGGEDGGEGNGEGGKEGGAGGGEKGVWGEFVRRVEGRPGSASSTSASASTSTSTVKKKGAGGQGGEVQVQQPTPPTPTMGGGGKGGKKKTREVNEEPVMASL